MKVSELIKKLQEVDQDLEVLIEEFDYDCGISSYARLFNKPEKKELYCYRDGTYSDELVDFFDSDDTIKVSVLVL